MAISTEILVTHFDYTKWASMLLVEACKALPPEELEGDLKASHRTIIETLRHVFFVDRMWLGRFEGAAPKLRGDDERPSLAELEKAWPELLDRFESYIVSTGDEGVMQPFTFRMLSGQESTLPRWQALLHVVNHGSLHRGQAVAMLRQLGHQPPQTDLITYYRMLIAPSK